MKVRFRKIAHPITSKWQRTDDPSQAEIAAMTAQIRSTWDDAEYRRRAGMLGAVMVNVVRASHPETVIEPIKGPYE